ncbi:hypothetical protein KBX71_26475 [Micromonospora sp. D93]|uniref:hypothetical protein n=1 Tax=Micromonospora sp. D93 TaxID=2824886 RepID=UPI001B37FAAD|nr:hypothetical protein [Micromonospora sp. D93]MBQ1021407.1 hypothetical protein [Micromonospora sp. D93]
MRAAAIGLWLFATAVTALGLYGDRCRWWDNAPFATNLVSSVAGASFGVPIALLILATLSAQQALMTAQREAQKFAIRLLRRIADAPRMDFELSSDYEQIDQIVTILGRAREFVRSHPNGYQAIGSVIDPPPSPRGQIKQAERLLQGFPTAVARCAYDCSGAWELFRTEARLRLAEHGLPSVDYERARHIEQAVEALKSMDRRLGAELKLSEIWERYEQTDTRHLTANLTWLDDSDSELLADPPAHALVKTVDAIELALTAMRTLMVEASAAVRDLEGAG